MSSTPIPIGYVLGQVFVYLATTASVVAAIYGNVLVFRVRSNISIQKRGIVSHFGMNFALIFWIICNTFMMAANISVPSYSLYLITLVATAICGYSFICFCLIKSWLIYYHEKWSYHTLRGEWYKMLNNNADRADSNWYIRNNHKYGSRAYVTKACIIYHSIGMIITSFGIIVMHLGDLPLVIENLLVITPIAPSFVLYLVIICKTTRFKLIDDPFLIHWESKLHSRLQLLFIIILFFTAPITGINVQIGWMVAAFMPNCILYALIHISTFSIYKRLRAVYSAEAELSSQQSLSRLPTLQFVASNEVAGSSGSIISSASLNFKVKLQMVMCNKKALHLFVQHLVKEYSPECVLSVIEIQQYQNYLLSELESEEREKVDRSYDVELADKLPLSAIVEDADTDWRLKAYALYDKYIRAGCEYEVNISWTVRNEFTPLMSNSAQFLLRNHSLKMQDFYILYDKVKVEMIKLLRYSLDRFKFKDDYDKMVMILKEAQHYENAQVALAVEEASD